MVTLTIWAKRLFIENTYHVNNKLKSFVSLFVRGLKPLSSTLCCLVVTSELIQHIKMADKRATLKTSKYRRVNCGKDCFQSQTM